ncbi:MAG: polysaccharide biosynthesis/export family protein [Terriglobales bacterium]
MNRVWNWTPVVVVLVTMGLAAQDSSQIPAGTSSETLAKQTSRFSNAPTFSERYPRYRLSASDSFDLTFEYTPEWNQSVTVQPDGYITLRSVGDVYVNGLTADQTKQKLEELYGKVLNKPVISISLRDFQRPYFIADGRVNKPGKYELRGDTTAMQAIAMAGGFAPREAKHSSVILFRRVDDNWVETKVIDIKTMQKTGDLSEDVHLRPGDMLFVPQNTLSKIQQWIPLYSVGLLGAQTKAF